MPQTDSQQTPWHTWVNIGSCKGHARTNCNLKMRNDHCSLVESGWDQAGKPNPKQHLTKSGALIFAKAPAYICSHHTIPPPPPPPPPPPLPPPTQQKAGAGAAAATARCKNTAGRLLEARVMARWMIRLMCQNQQIPEQSGKAQQSDLPENMRYRARSLTNRGPMYSTSGVCVGHAC